MKKVSQYILAFLFFALIFELIIIGPLDIKENTVGVQNKEQLQINPQNSDINQSMETIHVIEAKNENKEWELWSDTAVGFRNQNDFEVKKVKVNFFAQGGVSFDVTGDNGSMTAEANAKHLKIDGGVVTKSSNGYIFKTTAVEYNSESRTLKSKTPVEVLGPKDDLGKQLQISGNEMHADLKEGIVLIENDVRARKSVASNRMMAVNSQKVQLSGRERSVRFLGNVVIDLDGMRISGPDALFNYDRDTHQLSSIDLSGGVKVSDLSKWATSDNLNINLVKNEFTFDGKPRVVQDNDEVRGDKIVFLDGGKKVKVQNAKIKMSRDSLDDKKVGKEL